MSKLGNKNKVYIVNSPVTALSGVTAGDVLVGETTNNVNINANLVEVSDKSTEYQEFIPGIKGGSLSVTVNVNDGDTKQEELIDSIEAGSSVNTFVGDPTVGGFAGKALVASIVQTNDNGSVATYQIDLTYSGKISRIKS